MDTVKVPKRIQCYAFKDGELWVICSLQFGLAAQADSLTEAKAKIDAQIDDYIEGALHESPEVAKRLLARRAPIYCYLHYFVGWLQTLIENDSHDDNRRKRKVFRLHPAMA